MFQIKRYSQPTNHGAMGEQAQSGLFTPRDFSSAPQRATAFLPAQAMIATSRQIAAPDIRVTSFAHSACLLRDSAS